MRESIAIIFYFVSFFLLLLWCKSVNAQCPTGDVELYTQADVDAFVIAYPSCTSINGYLYIGDAGFGSGTSDINNISGLSNITNIQNSLYIYNTSLTNLNGISGISSSGIYIDIQGNSDLNSIIGFNNIMIGGDIYIYNNNNLTNIDAFQLMTSVNSISIGGNSSLMTISGFNNTLSAGYIDISGNENLTDIDALQQLTSANSLIIYGNTNLSIFPTIANLTTLGGLNIANNNMQNLDNVFPNLNTVSSVSLGDLSNIHNLSLWTSSSITSIFLNNIPDVNNLNFLSQNLNLTNVNINTNPFLSICNNTSVCNLIYNNLPGSNNFNVSNNANGCSSFNEVWTSCTNLPYCSNITYPNQNQRVGVLTKLTWTLSNFATGYRIKAGTSPGSSNILNNIDVGNVLSYKFTSPLPYNASIFVTVTPYNQNGNAVGTCQQRSFLTYTQCPFGYQNFNQSVVDSFPSWFPNCSNLNGVQISANNIDSLYKITSVTNFLSINTSSTGPEKIGLRNLSYVNGNLSISNPGLIDLSNLIEVTGDLYLSYVLPPLKLNSLESVGNLYIVGNNTNASTLNNLYSVNDIDLIGFSSLDGLQSLNTVTGDFSIWVGLTSGLTNLTGLENLQNVGGLLGIYRYPAQGAAGPISNISALAGLSSVGGFALEKTLVSDLDMLSGISGNLTHLHLERNSQLNDISGLNNISEITQYLQIDYNGQLSNCSIQAICDALDQNLQTKIITANGTNCISIPVVEDQCILLPVKDLRFFINSRNNTVYLNWQTSSEINNHFFEIEHSIDGVSFNTIGKIPGHGTTSELKYYQYTDKRPSAGINYYRIKQVDYDGKYTFSDIRSVLVQRDGNDVSIYPNPVTSIINVIGAEGVNYSLYDLLGRQVKSGQISNSVISIDHLTTGMYYLHLDRDTGKNLYKIWKE
jgi:hypothetical protein